jgi:hypothetical protein
MKSVSAIGSAARAAALAPYLFLTALPNPMPDTVPSLPAASCTKKRGTVRISMTNTMRYPQDAPSCRPVTIDATSTSAIMTSQAGPNVLASLPRSLAFNRLSVERLALHH